MVWIVEQRLDVGAGRAERGERVVGDRRCRAELAVERPEHDGVHVDDVADDVAGRPARRTATARPTGRAGCRRRAARSGRRAGGSGRRSHPSAQLHPYRHGSAGTLPRVSELFVDRRRRRPRRMWCAPRGRTGRPRCPPSTPGAHRRPTRLPHSLRRSLRSTSRSSCRPRSSPRQCRWACTTSWWQTVLHSCDRHGCHVPRPRRPSCRR